MLVDNEVRELLETLTPRRPVADQWAAIAEAAGRRTRRRVLAVAAAAAAAVAGILAVGPARGLHDEAVRLLAGGDAPAPVQEALARIAGHRPVRAYVDLRTSVGARVTLFSMTGRSGEDCLGIAWSGSAGAGATCTRTRTSRPPLQVTESGSRVRGSWVALLWGRVAPDIQRLELVSTGGAAVAVPLSASHFLVEVPRWAGEAHLVAYGYGGLVLARHKLETAPSWTPPDPVGEK